MSAFSEELVVSTLALGVGIDRSEAELPSTALFVEPLLIAALSSPRRQRKFDFEQWSLLSARAELG